MSKLPLTESRFSMIGIPNVEVVLLLAKSTQSAHKSNRDGVDAR